MSSTKVPEQTGGLKLKPPLDLDFFMGDTVRVAEDLLGCYLVRETKSFVLMGRIVETEAYLGIEDPCCHSFQGLHTERTKTMYLPGGHIYVYFIYGKYYCFNVVTGGVNKPEAVLIRAVEPEGGISKMQENRKQKQLKDLCSGPGKLCQAFGINRDFNGHILSCSGEGSCGGGLYIVRGEPVVNLESNNRVGLPFDEDASYWPLRFYIKDNPFVSQAKTFY